MYIAYFKNWENGPAQMFAEEEGAFANRQQWALIEHWSESLENCCETGNMGVCLERWENPGTENEVYEKFADVASA